MGYGLWSMVFSQFITALISTNEILPGISQQDTGTATALASDNWHHHAMGTETRTGMAPDYISILLHITALLFFSFCKTEVQACHHQRDDHQYGFLFSRRINDLL
jgi:hypothetical protein